MCKTQMKKFPDWYRPPWSGGWMINILASASSQGYNQPPVRGTTSQGYNQPLVRCTTSHGYNQSGVQPATIQGYNQPPVRGTTSHQSGVQPATSQGYNQPLVRSTTSQGYNNLIKLGAYSGLGPWINQARGRRGNVCTCSPLSTYSHLRQSLLPIM